MATDLDKLCDEILEKAHKIELDIQGKKQIFYFLTPEDEVYSRLSRLTVKEVKELMKRSGISLSYVDVKKNLATQYSENGAAGMDYAKIPAEFRIRIEEILGVRKKPDIYN